MAIIEYRADSTPPAVFKRIMRKNDKSALSRALRDIWMIETSETLTDAEKLKQIQAKLAGVLF